MAPITESPSFFKKYIITPVVRHLGRTFFVLLGIGLAIFFWFNGCGHKGSRAEITTVNRGGESRELRDARKKYEDSQERYIARLEKQIDDCRGKKSTRTPKQTTRRRHENWQPQRHEDPPPPPPAPKAVEPSAPLAPEVRMVERTKEIVRTKIIHEVEERPVEHEYRYRRAEPRYEQRYYDEGVYITPPPRPHGYWPWYTQPDRQDWPEYRQHYEWRHEDHGPRWSNPNYGSSGGPQHGPTPGPSGWTGPTGTPGGPRHGPTPGMGGGPRGGPTGGTTNGGPRGGPTGRR